MRKPALIYLLIALTLVAVYLLTRDTTPQPAENKSFAQKIEHLTFTRHGKCRMACRQITEAEVRDIILNGSINAGKSDPRDRPCPTIALEGYSQADNQHIRVVVADCPTELKLVTCIDLDQDHQCTCK